MADESGISSIVSGIQSRLEAMINQVNLVPGYLSRVVYRQYQNAQRMRWASENATMDAEGGIWDRLDPEYAKYKERKWPGTGDKILVRTQKLLDSVIGPSSDHVMVVDSSSIRISTLVPYASFVDERRTFSQFSPIFYQEVYSGLKDYLTKSVTRQIGGGL